MDEQVTRLVDKAWARFQETPADRRFMIAIGGIPGSGKTTLSQMVTQALNARHADLSPGAKDGVPIAAFVPMDGYHLTRAQLSALPDPTRAHARRGAEFTFDGAAFLTLVKALREPLTASSGKILAPSFDHAVKDPKNDDIVIDPGNRIIVFEGNYVVLEKDPWREAAALMDERWFVDVDFEVARRRLVARHVKAGIASDEEEAGKRADENDLVNGRQVVENRTHVHEVVVSRDDEKWKHE
ncbi:P-loop containing nucleoside triphosphate hydrolase protein [Astrocystis sublimbata]|nr:P-loop containing nucleoside triphosphate hydrolase protein [Astrocystis sublimbata]